MDVKEFLASGVFISISVVLVIIGILISTAPCWIGGGALYLGDKALEQQSQK